MVIFDTDTNAKSLSPPLNKGKMFLTFSFLFHIFHVYYLHCNFAFIQETHLSE